MSELTVDKRDVEDVTLLYPKGFINAHTVRLFEGEIRGALQQGRFKIVVNCSGLSYIASAGLGALMGAIEEIRGSGGTFGCPASTTPCGTSSRSSVSTTSPHLSLGDGSHTGFGRTRTGLEAARERCGARRRARRRARGPAWS
jgi:anti-anti-sigma factor